MSTGFATTINIVFGPNGFIELMMLRMVESFLKVCCTFVSPTQSSSSFQ